MRRILLQTQGHLKLIVLVAENHTGSMLFTTQLPAQAALSALCSILTECWVCRPPSYIISLQNGAQMPALYSHLILLQQASQSGKQSLSQRHFQEAKTASASPGGSNVNSMHSPPHSSGGASFVNTGDTQARPSGRSDLSQALLFNTAALESNLAAAQRGDGIGFGDAGDTNTVDADLGTSQTFSGPEPTTSNSVSGACHPKVMQAQPFFGVLHDPWSNPECSKLFCHCRATLTPN